MLGERPGCCPPAACPGTRTGFSLQAPAVQACQLLRRLPELAGEGWILSEYRRLPQAAVAVKVLASDAMDLWGDRAVQRADRSLFCSLGRTEGSSRGGAGESSCAAAGQEVAGAELSASGPCSKSATAVRNTWQGCLSVAMSLTGQEY